MNPRRKDIIDDRMVVQLHHMGISCSYYILHKNTDKKQITEKIE